MDTNASILLRFSQNVVRYLRKVGIKLNETRSGHHAMGILPT